MNQRPFYKNHFTALDGLRGVGLLTVIIAHHIPLPLSFLAMDSFFVLSGFLITGILLDTKNDRSYFKNFYARRVLRILPIYYLTLFIFFYLLKWFFSLDTQPDFDFYFNHEFSFWAYYQNFTLVEMDRGQSHSFGHLWSLAVEEQYYVLVPFVVILFSKRQLIYVFGGVVFTALVYRIYNFLWDGPWIKEYFFTISRMDVLAMGGIIAILVRTQSWEVLKVYRNYFKLAAAIFAAYFIVWALFTDYNLPTIGIMQRTFNYTLSGIMLSMLILLIVLKDNYTTRLLSLKLFTYFGKRSYAIYIFHMPIKYMLVPFLTTHVFWLTNLGKWPKICLSLSLAITFGEISWRLIEKPALGLKEHFRYGKNKKVNLVTS